MTPTGRTRIQLIIDCIVKKTWYVPSFFKYTPPAYVLAKPTEFNLEEYNLLSLEYYTLGYQVFSDKGGVYCPYTLELLSHAGEHINPIPWMKPNAQR